MHWILNCTCIFQFCNFLIIFNIALSSLPAFFTLLFNSWTSLIVLCVFRLSIWICCGVFLLIFGCLVLQTLFFVECQTLCTKNCRDKMKLYMILYFFHRALIFASDRQLSYCQITFIQSRMQWLEAGLQFLTS